MAVTTNYGWTKPTVGGDSGAWGGIVNTVLDSIDAAVKARETEAAAALAAANVAKAENLSFPLLFTGTLGQAPVSTLGSPTTSRNYQYVNFALGSSDQVLIVVPISGLTPGMRITGYKYRGLKNCLLTVELLEIDTTGAATTVSSDTSLGNGAEATITVGSLSKDVTADKHYMFRCSFVGTGVSGTNYVRWLQPTVTRP